MSRDIVVTDTDTEIEVVEGEGGEPVRVRIGSETHGVTLVGDLVQVQRLIVEADRQVARLATRSPRRRGAAAARGRSGSSGVQPRPPRLG
jgi:hypothetical protein